MKSLTVQIRLLLLLTLLLIISYICLTIGASLLNYSQTRTQNEERLKTAMGSFQREFNRAIVNDEHLFHESLTNSLEITLAFKAMVLIDDSDIRVPTKMSEIGTLLHATRLAFYYQVEGHSKLRLRLYYDRELGGTSQMYIEDKTLKRRLIHKNTEGLITVSEIGEAPQPLSMTFPAFEQSHFLQVKNGVLLLVADLPYISVFNDVDYSLQQGEELGRFVLEKPLDLNLQELDNDLGVHFTVYDRHGTMGQGEVRMPDLDLAQEKKVFSNERVIELSDTDGNTYDSMLMPLTYQNVTVGYISANISQEKTFQKIWETVRVLFLIALVVMVIALMLLSLVVVRIIARPLKHMAEVARRQLEGDLDARIELVANDEYGQLRQTFNMLSNKLSKILQEQHITITDLKQAQEALRRQAEELATLQATVLDITTPHDLPTLLQTIVERAARLLDTLGGGMYLCDPIQEEVRCVVSYNAMRDYTGTMLKYGEGAAGTVAQTGKPLIIDDYRIWPGRAAAFEEDQPFTTVIAVPMIWEDQVIGVIDLLHNMTSRCFTQTDLKLLILFANHATIAVENTRLYEQAQQEIAERQRAEEQIKNQNILLEQAVQEKQREMEALFERLLRQQKLATIGHMAGNIAHELRNPLGAIKNSVFFLKRLWQKQQLDASSPKVQEHLDLIDSELDTSERVIAYLLQMAQMKPPQREQTNLRPIIEDAAERCHLPKRIQYTIELDPEPFLIWADSLQLRQVFINLLTNAMQAIEQEGCITISAKQLTGEKSCVIKVEDNGTGIESDLLDNVFEPLYTTKATGTGLGLSICKQIIENHHGHIGMRSEKGQGTTVTIVLLDQE